MLFEMKESQDIKIKELTSRIGKLPTDIQDYIVDRVLSYTDTLLIDYANKTKGITPQNEICAYQESQDEVWRDITLDGVSNQYQVSNFGRVRNIKRRISEGGQILSIRENPWVGYVYLTIKARKRVKHYRVHRLVAQAFIPNPNNLPEVNHIDENPLNNRVENLEWCSRAENGIYGTRNERMLNTRKSRGLCNGGVSIIGIDPQTMETKVRFDSMREAELNGYYRATIRQRINGNCKTLYKGLIWQRVG